MRATQVCGWGATNCLRELSATGICYWNACYNAYRNARRVAYRYACNTPLHPSIPTARASGFSHTISCVFAVLASQIPKLLFWPGETERAGGSILLTLGNLRAILNHERVRRSSYL